MYSTQIQWYPGHIAKAEKNLKEQLSRVDVVLEVLDARIPLASHHPHVAQWIGAKPRILVINREDMIPEAVLQQWQYWFRGQGEKPYFVNAKAGKGVSAITKAAQVVGEQVNERRSDRGMLPRPVRAVVIGFPNVGKSALINRLVGRKAVASARRPGVTRQLHWVRISPEIELLDAPGVIPLKLVNQKDAVKLAICEDIGEAAYIPEQVAAVLVDLLVELGSDELLKRRYHVAVDLMTGEEYVYNLAHMRYKGETQRAALQILNDFRTQVLGQIPLELPPTKKLS